MPKHSHYDDLQKIEEEHTKMRGIIDALILFDQNPPKDFEAWRMRADTLHWVMETQLTDADSALHAALKSSPCRSNKVMKR